MVTFLLLAYLSPLVLPFTLFHSRSSPFSVDFLFFPCPFLHPLPPYFIYTTHPPISADLQPKSLINHFSHSSSSSFSFTFREFQFSLQTCVLLDFGLCSRFVIFLLFLDPYHPRCRPRARIMRLPLPLLLLVFGSGVCAQKVSPSLSHVYTSSINPDFISTIFLWWFFPYPPQDFTVHSFAQKFLLDWGT